MTPSLDLILLPIVRVGGLEQTTLPGMHIATPPRRPARSRQGDQLLLYLSLGGTSPLAAEYQEELLAGLAHKYYQTSGSATAAQRRLAEDLNHYLLERNLRNASTGYQSVGLFTQVVLRNDHISIAQSGPVHAFLLAGGETQHLYDVQLAGRGLGISRTITVRFSLANLSPNDAFVLTENPPASWTATTLQTTHRQGLESLRRYLVTQTLPDMNALLVEVQPGQGQIRLARPPRPVRPRPARAGAPAEKRPVGQAAEPAPAQAMAGRASPAAPASPPRSSGQAAAQPAAPTAPPSTAKHKPPASRPDRLRPVLAPLLAGLAVIGRAFSTFFRQVGWGLLILLRRVLPDETLFTLPPATMIFFALAVPLIVVAASSTAYFQRGRAAQYQAYIQQAASTAQTANQETDPQKLHLAWEEVLRLLAEADRFRPILQGDDTTWRALKEQATGVLDSLDYVERLDFLPALTSQLSPGVHISRMVATDTDLYLLNAKDGIVLRAAFTNSGYALDQTFQCGPGVYGGQIVGAIIAIAALPLNSPENATLLGMDTNGGLLYCIPGKSPLAFSLASANTNWGPPQGMTIDQGNLYVLDPQNNAVWIYRGLQTANAPDLFFGTDIPPMGAVIDLTLNRDDLFLLHTDGHITKCVYNSLAVSTTDCRDPFAYTDPRPGRQSEATIQGAHFTEILFTPPPEPSIYLLEPESRAIYQFGVGLTFYHQFQARSELPAGPASAMAISRGNRFAFLALGNLIYYANLP
jgi:hypothetical protein